MDISLQIKATFDGNAGKDTLYFTVDESGFFTEAQAVNQANNLKAKKMSGVITPITRAEVNAWFAMEAPTQLAAAQERLATAEGIQQDAAAKLAALPAKATVPQKAPHFRANNDAARNVKLAQAQVDVWQREVDKLNAVADAGVKDAETKLATDSTANADSTVISADTTAVENAKAQTAQGLLDTAQKAFNAATETGNADEIATAKKALTVAKARVTRENNKA